MEKIQWNSINKKQNGLEQSKNHPPSPNVVRECYLTKHANNWLVHCNNSSRNGRYIQQQQKLSLEESHHRVDSVIESSLGS